MKRESQLARWQLENILSIKKKGERHRGRNGDTVEGTGHGMGGEGAVVFVAAAGVPVH